MLGHSKDTYTGDKLNYMHRLLEGSQLELQQSEAAVQESPTAPQGAVVVGVVAGMVVLEAVLPEGVVEGPPVVDPEPEGVVGDPPVVDPPALGSDVGVMHWSVTSPHWYWQVAIQLETVQVASQEFSGHHVRHQLAEDLLLT